MSKRLAPVLELSDSCSESSSPRHNRLQVQQRTKAASLNSTSDKQVWEIIQSRRNLDKKVRNVQSRVQSSQRYRNKLIIAENSPTSSFVEPSEIFQKALNRKKIEIFKKNQLSKEKNKENKEKMHEKARKARNEIKQQKNIATELIKKREENMINEKKEKVHRIKYESREALQRRRSSNQSLAEINCSDYLNRIQKMNEAVEHSIKLLESKQEALLEALRSKSALKVNHDSSYKRCSSAVVSPRYKVY